MEKILYIVAIATIVFLSFQKRKEGFNMEEVLSEQRFNGLDSELKDNLINLAKEEQDLFVQEICNGPANVDLRQLNQLDSAEGDLPWNEFRNDYILKVESGNAFVEKLKKIEEKFFRSKYGDAVYENLLNERKNNEEIMLQKIAESAGYISNSNPTNHCRTDSSIFKDIQTQITLNNALQALQGEDVAKTLSKGINFYEKELEDLYGEKYTNNRKVEYRDNEIIKISGWNSVFNVLYYVIFVSLLITLALSKSLNLRSNAFLYLILAVLPIYIFPFLFQILIKFSRFVHESFNKNVHGPKNAFLDKNYK